MMSKPTILISGGAGFVGRNLVKYLLDEQDSDIWIVDDLSTGLPPERWELYPARLDSEANGIATYRFTSRPDQCFRLIRANFAAVLGAELALFPSLGLSPLPQFTEIYHLASIVGGRAVIEGKPLLVGFDLAIDSLLFLWAATVNKPDRLLYPSSSAAYPVSLQSESGAVSLAEEMIDFDHGVLSPDLTYGWSKLTGEYLARIAVQKHGMNVAVVRPFSGYGEDQDPSYPVPAIALRVAARQDPVRVWGNGQQGRDFVHIDDCVSGVVRSCRTISNGTAVNLGSGVLTSFADLAAMMVRIEGYSSSVQGTDARPVGVARRYASVQNAERLIGWQPAISLEAGMTRVIRHAHWRLQNGYEPRL